MWPFRKREPKLPFTAERAYHIEFWHYNALLLLGHVGQERAVRWLGSRDARSMATDRVLADLWLLGLEPTPRDPRTKAVAVSA
jgi:hypothetical protein